MSDVWATKHSCGRRFVDTIGQGFLLCMYTVEQKKTEPIYFLTNELIFTVQRSSMVYTIAFFSYLTPRIITY